MIILQFIFIATLYLLAGFLMHPLLARVDKTLVHAPAFMVSSFWPLIMLLVTISFLLEKASIVGSYLLKARDKVIKMPTNKR